MKPMLSLSSKAKWRYRICFSFINIAPQVKNIKDDNQYCQPHIMCIIIVIRNRKTMPTMHYRKKFFCQKWLRTFPPSPMTPRHNARHPHHNAHHPYPQFRKVVQTRKKKSCACELTKPWRESRTWESQNKIFIWICSEFTIIKKL